MKWSEWKCDTHTHTQTHTHVIHETYNVHITPFSKQSDSKQIEQSVTVSQSQSVSQVVYGTRGVADDEFRYRNRMTPAVTYSCHLQGFLWRTILLQLIHLMRHHLPTYWLTDWLTGSRSDWLNEWMTDMMTLQHVYIIRSLLERVACVCVCVCVKAWLLLCLPCPAFSLSLCSALLFVMSCPSYLILSFLPF